MMQINWSLMLNALLLIVVVAAITRLLKAKRTLTQDRAAFQAAPSLGTVNMGAFDEVISVRKIEMDDSSPMDAPALKPTPKPTMYVPPKKTASVVLSPAREPLNTLSEKPSSSTVSLRPQPNQASTIVEKSAKTESIMIFLLAKGDRQLAGYELLQTVLAAGLRFGEGHLFHRHQFPNGQGPVLCSLAAATELGTFDLQHIGAFSVRGLCLFMRASGNPTIDAERLSIMLDTAKQLSEGLDTLLLDEQQKPFNDATIKRYQTRLNLGEDLTHETV